jgi:hypothetical protein
MLKKKTISRIIILCIFIGMMLLSWTFYAVESWNANSYLDTTRALIDRGTFSIDGYHNNTGDRIFWKGSYYSEKQPGLAILLTPAYWVFTHTIGELPRANGDNCAPQKDMCYENYPRYTLFVRMMTMLVSGLSIAGTLVLIFLMGKKRGARALPSLAYALLFLIGTMSIGMIKQFSNNSMGMFLALLFYYLIYESDNARRYGYAGLIACVAILVNVLTLIPIVMLILYRILKKEGNSIQENSIVIGGLLMGVIILLLFNHAIIGSLTMTLHADIDRSIFTQSATD